MKIISKSSDLSAFLKKLQPPNVSVSSSVIRTVEAILADVRKNGDKAVLKYTRRFDGLNVVGPDGSNRHILAGWSTGEGGTG